MRDRDDPGEIEKFRTQIAALLADRDGWDGYEHISHWLKKLLQPSHGDVYTSSDSAAVARIAMARRQLYGGWDGYDVPALIAVPLRYVSDLHEDDELVLRDLAARGVNRLQRRELRWIVGLWQIAGLDIKNFDRDQDEYESAA